MPIEGRSLGDVVRKLGHHLNALLSATVTSQDPLIPLTLVSRSKDGSPPRMMLSFRRADGQRVDARLRTRYGTVGLGISQVCESYTTPEHRHRLVTVGYQYTITPEGAASPLLRWEYLRRYRPETARWCRHHLQGTILVPIGAQPVPLSRWHLPTGFVTVEEILRFCIVDLEVPPLSRDWHERLEDSYRLIKTQFAPQGADREP